MAVQKSRKSRARRDTRRSHDRVYAPAVSINSAGQLHQRHHIDAQGMYRGKQILKQKPVVDVDDVDTDVGE